MNPIIRFYLTIRQSGWFVPSFVGGLPFPFTWQAWALFGAWIVGVVATTFVPLEIGWVCRVALGVAYLAVGVISYKGSKG